ncbi:MAG: hypothetical protein ACKPKO_15505, partial [Candidatus Fonsibacter sp.]
MNFSDTDFDGCMYGLVSVKDSNNCPVRKPWRIASINSTLGKHLNRLCDGSHSHVPCNGPDAVFSQGYTTDIWKAIYKSGRDRIK